jgi:activating signal cointegrator complex subunit 2
MTLVQHLPPYPSASARKSLTPNQLTRLKKTIVSSLAHTLTLPRTNPAVPAFRTFLASYTKDAAVQALQSLVWNIQTAVSNDDKTIREQVWLLAEKLALSSPGIEIQTLLNLAIIYAPTNATRARSLFSSALKSTPSLATTFETEVVPAFKAHLAMARSSGLYSLRKSAHCISCVLHISPPEIVRHFSYNKDFIVALASVYDEDLTAIARSYGGLRVPPADGRDLDEWERVWVQTKVELMDTFHVLVAQMLQDLCDLPDNALSNQSERIFDILFHLVDMSSSSVIRASNTGSSQLTPFLNHSLLADYQHAYDLSQTLASTFRKVAEKDARLDVLEAALSSFDLNPPQSSKNDPGALMLLLRSPLGRNGLGKEREKIQITELPDRVGDKGKSKATFNATSFLPPDTSSDLDFKVSQVLDIHPGYPLMYIRELLTNPAYSFRGNAEKLVEALLEGTAPTLDEVDVSLQARGIHDPYSTAMEDLSYTKDRHNAFDDDIMDLSLVHFGKKRCLSCILSLLANLLMKWFDGRQDEATVLHDRKFIEEMKADILRRAEAISDDEDEDVIRPGAEDVYGGEEKETIMAEYEEELDLGGPSRLKVLGDGEQSSEDGVDDEDQEGPRDGKTRHESPETILELAYIRDPGLFARDAQTRRGKPRADLKNQTGPLFSLAMRDVIHCGVNYRLDR